MDLRAYVTSFPKSERAAVRKRIADALGVTEPAVRHWCNGIRRITPETAIEIETATNGAVRKEAMLPNIFGKRNGKAA